MKLKRIHRKKLFAAGLISGALLLIGGFAVLWLYGGPLMSAQPSASPSHIVRTVPMTPHVIEGHPTHLDIPSLHMSLPIIDGVYDKNTRSWTLTLDKVQYATVTPEPNNAGGNTFLYGHYRWEVFATLHTIKPGARAIIKTDNGHVFTYTYLSNRVVDPDDTSVFKYQGAPILTIQTCTGIFFQYRQLFTFTLTGVS